MREGQNRMDTKSLFRYVDNKVPIQLRYISLICLLSCSLPLFWQALPNQVTLLVIAVFLIITWFFSKQNIIVYLVICVMTMSHFVWNAEKVIEQKLPYSSARQTITIQAEIVHFPREDSLKKSIVVRLIQGCVDSLCQHDDGRFALSKQSLVSLSCYRCEFDFVLGEVWQFSVKLKPPRSSTSWGMFDYEKYAFANGIAATGYINQQASFRLSKQTSFVNSFRLFIHDVIRQALSETASQPIETALLTRAFILALVVGDRSELDSHVWQIFSQTGVSHLVAISGLHISFVFFVFSTLVYFASAYFLRFVAFVNPSTSVDKLVSLVSLKSLAMWFGFVVALIYALCAGFTLPTQRALLMLFIYNVLYSMKVQINLFDLLCAAIFLILAMDPLSTMQTGFWLSVIAVMLICFLIHTKESIIFKNMRLALAMAPLSFSIFGVLPWISPVANAVLIPLVTGFVLPVAFLVISLESIFTLFFNDMVLFQFINHVFTFLWQFIDSVLLFCWQLLTHLANWQNALTIPFFQADEYRQLCVVIAFILLIVCWRLIIAKYLLVFPLIAIVLLYEKPSLNEGEFILTVLDVGQGLAIVIETHESTLLFDTGIGFSTSDSAQQTILPFLRKQQLNRPDKVIISHGDNDHIGGAKTVAEQFPDIHFLSNDRVHAKSFLFTDLCYGKQWQSAGVVFRIFPRFQAATNSNDSSCVLKIVGKYASVLLPADVQRSAERHLVEKYAHELSSDVLVLGHHGSKTSSTPAFINQVKPDIAIVSAAYFNSHGHPHPSVIDRVSQYGSQVLSTAESGSIQIRSVKNGLEQREYRAMHPRFWYSQP